MTGLTRAAGRIARRWQVRVTRILRQLLGELGNVSSQHLHLCQQRRDLGVPGCEGGLELDDPLLRVQQQM